ncbi:hypothetical protein KAU51_00015 [Candidatus Parcubacteria bacterium]|nr:hypothetical protein [Candidatus Parcubacteria bacterium]
MSRKFKKIALVSFLFCLLFCFFPNVLAKNSIEEPKIFNRVDFLEDGRDFLNLIKEVNKKDFQKKQEALKKSSNVKGIYLTQYTGGSSSSWAKDKRKEIKKLLRETELNGVVIDVKEVKGQTFTDSLKKFIDELHKNDSWVIARIVVCRDSSMINIKPEWYLKNSSGSLWQDRAGYFWLDPACPDVQNYILEVSQKAIDFGFDEIQFDYLRFPDRGEIEDIIYPCYNKEREKREAINDFYLVLSDDLRNYKKDIILSIDLFGLVAQYLNISGTGQNLLDTLDKFDYISFMLYPSHFFSGFAVQKDIKRNLPALYFPYKDENIKQVVSEHPYEVVSRTLFNVSDYLSSLVSSPPHQTSSSAFSTKTQNRFSLWCEGEPKKDFKYLEGYLFSSLLNYFFWEYKFFLEDLNKTKTRIRPWLQDFDLKVDSGRGIYYDAKKVRAQIKASEDANSSGWLLWNPWNVYTKEALKP